MSTTADAVGVSTRMAVDVQNLPDMPYPHADDDANTGVALMGLTFICGLFHLHISSRSLSL